MLPTNDYKPASRYLIEKKLGKFIICLQGHIVSAKRIHEYFQEENKRLINQPRSNHRLKGKSKENTKRTAKDEVMAMGKYRMKENSKKMAKKKMKVKPIKHPNDQYLNAQINAVANMETNSISNVKSCMPHLISSSTKL